MRYTYTDIQVQQLDRHTRRRTTLTDSSLESSAVYRRKIQSLFNPNLQSLKLTLASCNSTKNSGKTVFAIYAYYMPGIIYTHDLTTYFIMFYNLLATL